MSQRTVVVSGLPDDITTEKLIIYFQSRRRSNGGDVESAQVQPDTGCTEVTFSSHLAANRVLLKTDHVIDGHRITVSKNMDHVKKQEPYKLQVLGVSENTTKDGLWSYMENISEKEVIDIECLQNSGIVLVTLKESTDLKKLQTKCSARSLDGNYLKVEHISTIMDLQESEECKVNGIKDEAKDIRTDIKKDIKNEDKDLMTFEPESENSKPNTSGNSLHADILLSKSIVQVLTSVPGSRYLEAKLKRLFGKVTFCKDESDETKLVLHASDQTHIDKAKDLIKKMTTEEIISLHAQHKALLKSNFIILDILEKFPLIKIDQEGDEVCFAGFKEQVDQAKSLLSAHFQEKAIEQRYAIRAGYEKQNEFLIRFKETELKEIENLLKDESVKFGLRNTLCEITIAGTQKGADRAYQELMQLIEEIKEKTIKVKNSETNKLLKKKGQLEHDCKCIIEVTEYPTNTFADTSSKIKQGVRILIVKDDIAKEKVDAIVNTISPDLDLSKNASAKALSDAAGPELQQELKLKGNMSVGGMIVTSGYNLDCKKVFHVCPGIPTQEKVLRSLVVQCLEEAHKKRFSSIAFPAIGTGHLGFPRDEVAKIFFEEVDKFKKKNPKTLILEVHFTLFHGDQATIDAFEKEEANVIQRQKAVGGVDKLIFPQIIEGDIAKEKVKHCIRNG